MSTVKINFDRTETHFEATNRLLSYAFNASPPLWASKADDQDRAWFDITRHHTDSVTVWEGAHLVCNASTLPLQHNVRGVLRPAWGVWGVATDPAARRKGYVRAAMRRLFEEARGHGVALSLLYPFRESFYTRLGYVTFPQPRRASFKARTCGPLLTQSLAGHVERRSTADAFDDWRAYLRQQHLPAVHGLALSDSDWPQVYTRIKHHNWAAFAHIDGAVHGAMLYTLRGEQGAFKMDISALFTDDIRARYLLLAWTARHIDHADEVVLRLGPGEFPETWLADLDVKTSSAFAGMARIVDVRGLDGLPAGDGHFTAQIVDEHAPWNDGTYTFTGDGGALTVRQADSADCTLTIQGLTALLYGTHDPASFAPRGWGDPTPATQAVMRAMFPPRLPYLYESF